MRDCLAFEQRGQELLSAKETGMNSADFRGTLAAVLIIGLLTPAASANAQQKVYKWVDEEGVVHFSEEPPDESPEAKVETFTTDPAPAYIPPAEPSIRSRSASETHSAKQSAKPDIQRPSSPKGTDITAMSLEELDRRCEAAREKKLAPLREAEIAECIETGTGDQSWCETFWADYGDPVRTKSGFLTPRMFHDLPECTEALDERHRRVSSR
jgi:hypothetical protein